MAESFKRLAQVQPGTSAATFYTVPGATTAIIKHIRIVNTSGSASVNVALYHGGTAAANQILPLTTIPVNGIVEMDVFIIGEAAQTFAASASVATQATLTVYGLTVT